MAMQVVEAGQMDENRFLDRGDLVVGKLHAAEYSGA